jgi:hypothetical protein
MKGSEGEYKIAVSLLLSSVKLSLSYEEVVQITADIKSEKGPTFLVYRKSPQPTKTAHTQTTAIEVSKSLHTNKR